MIYDDINQLIRANPNIKAEPCKIRLINWRMGFGAAMTILLNNAVYLERLNRNIVVEPLWNANSKNFRYHDVSLENSFYEYFTEKNPKDSAGLKIYTVRSTPHKWAKTRTRPKGWGQDEIDVNYFKRHYELNKTIKNQVEQYLNKLPRPLYGVHFRSNRQKRTHYPNKLCNVPEICSKLARKHPDGYFFVATDTQPYLKIARRAFSKRIGFFQGFLRVDSDALDSMPGIKAPPSLRFGYEILKDAYALSQCDIFYYSKSNVHFLTRLLGNNRSIPY